MSLDSWSTTYFLTEKGWIEKPSFKGRADEIVEEWGVSIKQASIKSAPVVRWSQTGETDEKLKTAALRLSKKYPKPDDF
jgi:hypothetical protein